MPSVNPASPPPAIVMDFITAILTCCRHLAGRQVLRRQAAGGTFLRDEQMAEPTGALLGQLPVSFVRPERGKFFTDKTRPHAHRRVVPRDRIAVNRPKQPAAKQRPGRAARL